MILQQNPQNFFPFLINPSQHKLTIQNWFNSRRLYSLKSFITSTTTETFGLRTTHASLNALFQASALFVVRGI
jgi:hypothetical protein